MTAWRQSGERRVLLRVYEQADATLAPYSCDCSADCCHFARTGREPSVTIGEWLEIVRAVRASGRRLPQAPSDDERTCPFLADGRCTIYESRPLGCRTYFCHRVHPESPPREPLARLVGPLRELAANVGDTEPRTLSSWLGLWGKRKVEHEGGTSRVGGARDRRRPR